MKFQKFLSIHPVTPVRVVLNDHVSAIVFVDVASETVHCESLPQLEHDEEFRREVLKAFDYDPTKIADIQVPSVVWSQIKNMKQDYRDQENKWQNG